MGVLLILAGVIVCHINHIDYITPTTVRAVDEVLFLKTLLFNKAISAWAIQAVSIHCWHYLTALRPWIDPYIPNKVCRHGAIFILTPPVVKEGPCLRSDIRIHL